MPDYYGPWTQAPDYEAESANDTAAPTLTPNWRYGEEDLGEGVEVTSAAVVDLVGFVRDSGFCDMSGDAYFVPQAPTTGAVQFSSDYTGTIFDPGPTIIRAGHFFAARSFSAVRGGLNNWAPFLLPDVPPDATGWQWQSDLTTGTGKPSAVIACEWTCRYDEQGYDSSIDVTPVGAWTTEVFKAPATYESDVAVGPTDMPTTWAYDAKTILFTIEGPGSGSLTVDLTDELDDMGRVTIGHRTPSFVIPGDLDQDERGVGYGYLLPTVGAGDLVWTFRPPIFRWIYATPQIHQAPPLRILQRGDAAISGAPRLIGQKTQQASNRIIGGIL